MEGRGRIVRVVDAEGGSRGQEDREGIGVDVRGMNHRTIRISWAIDTNIRGRITRGIKDEGILDQKGQGVTSGVRVQACRVAQTGGSLALCGVRRAP